MTKLNLEVGQKFGRWTVLEISKKIKGHGNILVRCKCDCGTIKEISHYTLLNGKSVSCGCLRKELLSNRENAHHKTNTKLYQIHAAMKARCFSKNHKNYKQYGGRGITVCDEWKNDFMAFYNWAMSNGYKEGLTIDRIDVNGNYEPNNCRWVTRKEQANNTRKNCFIEYNNEKHTIAEWCDILGITYSKLFSRLRKGLPLDKCFYPGKISNNGIDLL